MKRFNLALIVMFLSLGLYVSTAQAGLLEGQVGIVDKGALIALDWPSIEMAHQCLKSRDRVGLDRLYQQGRISQAPNAFRAQVVKQKDSILLVRIYGTDTLLLILKHTWRIER